MTKRSAARAVAGAGLLSLVVALAPLSGTAGVALADAGPWAQFHGTAQHTGYSATAGPRSVMLAWYGLFSDDVDASPAIAADGTIIGVSTDGNLQAFNPDGGQRWAVSLGSRVLMSPVLGQDGKVLVGDAAGRLRALNPSDGTFAWSKTGLGTVRGVVVAPDGTIFAGTDLGLLVAFDPDGTEKFRLQAAAGVTSAPALAANGDVYWATQDRHLARTTSTGNTIWSVAFDDGVIASSPAIGPDGTIVAGAGASLLAISPDSGAVKWRIGLGAPVTTTPAVAPDGSVYAGSDNGLLTAATGAGQVRWQYQAGGAIMSSPALGPDGLIYFGSGDANFYVLDQSGQKVSNYRALDAVHGAVAVGPTGLVLAGSRDNRLYAFKDSARSLTESPADRLGGDLARDPATGKVYVIVDGQRRYIPDPVTQQILGLAGPLPINLQPNELLRYPEGPALPAIREGTLLQESNGPIYVIKNGQRVWVRSLAEFAAAGYAWESVVQADDRVVRSIPLVSTDGLLLKGAGERVYQVSGNLRHWVTTAAVLAARGYTWSQVHYVSDAALGAIPEGDALS